MKGLRLLKTTLLVVTILFCLSSHQTVAAEEGEYEEDAVVEEDNGETITEKTVSLVEEVPYSSPEPAGHVYFAEHFDNPDVMETKWVKSQAKKEGIDDSIAKYDGSWSVEAAAKDPLNGDLGLIMKSKAKHAAISALLDKPFHFTDKPLIVQYDVTLQNGQECGGAYLKLLQYEQGMRLSQFTDKTPYSIMFGPDKCGNDNKLHFIFQHKNPKNGTVEEKHAKKPSTRLDEYFDKKPHLYRLQVYPDNTFDLSIDYKIVNKGSLLDDMVPPVNPPVEIDDPNDTKPTDWDERDKIPDPTATKPEDWDEDAPQEIVDEYAVKPSGWLEEEEPMIPDSAAEKPDDWDEEMDGTWEAPLLENPACATAPGCGKWKAPSVPNPDYRGKWRAPMIDNPNYRGKWRPKRIPNPDFYYDPNPFNMVPIGAVGIELWSMSDNILFDNVIITDDKSVADQWSASTFDIKRERVDSEGNVLQRMRGPSHMIQKIGRWMNTNDWAWPMYGLISFSPLFLFVGFLVWWVYQPSEEEEDSLVQRVLKYTNKRPWLWAVYVVAVALPVVIVLSLCFGKKEKKAQAAAAAAKKTDASSPDDAIAEEEAEPEGEAEEENSEVDELEGDEETALIQEEGADEKAEKQSPRRRRVRKE